MAGGPEETGPAPANLPAARRDLDARGQRTLLLELRRLVGTRRRRMLIVVTLLLGGLGAVAVSAGLPTDQRTFASTSMFGQLLMSVTVPFFGVLAVYEVRRTGTPGLRRRVLAAVALAAAIAVFGALVCAAVTAIAPSTAAGGRWQHAGAVVLGSVLVQLIAQLTGTGWGLLLRSPGFAMAATVVVPLGLWLVLGAVPTLSPAQAWLTPAASAGSLLSGQMRPLNWAQSLVVVLIWDVGLNAAGRYRIRRSPPHCAFAER